MGKIQINGMTIEGNNLRVFNGRVIVDGQDITGNIEIKDQILEIRVLEGIIGNLDTSASVTCQNITGDVDAGGSVSCGNVGGDVDAGGSVSCGNISGSVDAGGSVRCGSVGGSIDAGGGVKHG